MHARRVEELCTEVYRTIFEMLDGEVDLEGYEAGQIATITEQAFRKACLADTPPDQSWMLPQCQ